MCSGTRLEPLDNQKEIYNEDTINSQINVLVPRLFGLTFGLAVRAVARKLVIPIARLD